MRTTQKSIYFVHRRKHAAFELQCLCDNRLDKRGEYCHESWVPAEADKSGCPLRKLANESSIMSIPRNRSGPQILPSLTRLGLFYWVSLSALGKLCRGSLACEDKCCMTDDKSLHSTALPRPRFPDRAFPTTLVRPTPTTRTR